MSPTPVTPRSGDNAEGEGDEDQNQTVVGVGGADSILIRKNRLRRIISGGGLGLGSRRQSHFTAEGDGHCEIDCPETYVSPICSWNLNEECLLDAFLVLFEEAKNHPQSQTDINIQFFRQKFQEVAKEIKDMRVNMSDFNIGKIIHKGSFTSVQIVKEKSNGRILAMKSIDKFHHQVQKSLYLLDTELTIRSKNASQWIVKFNYAFQDIERVHFIMEFMAGGNFLSLLQRQGGRLNEELTRFYLGELVLAVNAVHSTGFAHRNIRPENILLDAGGHIKLSGLGLASRITKEGKVSSPLAVESASYEAPEILRTLGNDTFTYGIACDFWSLGVVAFEMFLGEHPFRSDCQLSTFKKITATKKIGWMDLPPFVSLELRDLIEGLLLEEEERINYQDCIRHSFFNSLIWDGLRNEIAPSIPPHIEEDEMDLGAGDYKLEPPTMIRGATKPISNVAFIGFTQTSAESEQVDQLLDNSSILDSSINDNDIIPWNNNNNNNRGVVTSSVNDSKLKSELQLKTELLMEKLNEIQILQTQLQKSSESLELREGELLALKTENKRLGAQISENLNPKISEEKAILEAKFADEKKALEARFCAKIDCLQRDFAEEREALLMELQVATETNQNQNRTSRLSMRGRMSMVSETREFEQLELEVQRESTAEHQVPNNNANLPGIDSNIISELKGKVCKLAEENSVKDDQILGLSVQVKILKHDLKLQELENQCLSRREGALEDTFAKSYKASMETLQGRIKELEEKLSEEGGKTLELEQRECKMKEFIDLKSKELTHLQNQMEEANAARKSSFDDIRKTRKKYAMTIGQLQDALDKALEECTEMKDKFDLIKATSSRQTI